MAAQKSIRHHFVPQWYQRNFLSEGKEKFFVLDKNPKLETLCPDGKIRKVKQPKYVDRSATKFLFQSEHLYSIYLPGVSEDILERDLFGKIDDLGSIANSVFLEWPKTIPMPKQDQYPMKHGNPSARMIDLLEFINAQKTRTPKGLDAIKMEFNKKNIGEIDNLVAMALFADRRKQLCTVWSEALWQIFTTKSKETCFLITDDPVMFYNMDCYPNSSHCRYPYDPNPFWRGTRVIFPLSSNKLLVLSHKEHVDNPSRNKAKRLRRNARMYQDSIISYTWIEHEKELSKSEVCDINVALKKRATRYIASQSESNLYPEKHTENFKWSDIDKIFKPKFKPFYTGSEVHVGYNDGQSRAWNAFGEKIESKADEMRQQVERLLKDKHEG